MHTCVCVSVWINCFPKSLRRFGLESSESFWEQICQLSHVRWQQSRMVSNLAWIRPHTCMFVDKGTRDTNDSTLSGMGYHICTTMVTKQRDRCLPWLSVDTSPNMGTGCYLIERGEYYSEEHNLYWWYITESGTVLQCPGCHMEMIYLWFYFWAHSIPLLFGRCWYKYILRWIFKMGHGRCDDGDTFEVNFKEILLELINFWGDFYFKVRGLLFY